MTQPPSLLCIGLTTVDVVALPVGIEPFDGVRLISAMQMAPAGTAAGTALVAAKLGVATQLAGAVGADAAGRFIRGELIHAGVDVTGPAQMPLSYSTRMRIFASALPGAARCSSAGSTCIRGTTCSSMPR